MQLSSAETKALEQPLGSELRLHITSLRFEGARMHAVLSGVPGVTFTLN